MGTATHGTRWSLKINLLCMPGYSDRGGYSPSGGLHFSLVQGAARGYAMLCYVTVRGCLAIPLEMWLVKDTVDSTRSFIVVL
jgi:hypothetical protein